MGINFPYICDMSNLGKSLFAFILLLCIAKAVVGSALPILKNADELLLVDESQQNEDTDDTFELDFSDEFIPTYNLISINCLKSSYIAKETILHYNSCLFKGHRNTLFKPPCI